MVCLWTKARENLPVDVKEWLASLEQGIQPNATATEQIDALIAQTKKQKDLEKSNHRFRKYFDKIIHWLDKVKGIGDVISSFDPVHAALPWAAFRFALQAVLAEKEKAESVLELLASTPHFIFSGRVLERVYTKESMHIGEAQDDIKLTQQCLNHLHEELIKFYSSLFSALQYCYMISSKHKVKRKATAIFNSSEVVSIHKDLEVQHKKVMNCGENCHKILNHTLSSNSLDLLEKIQPCLVEIGDQVRELLVRIDESERRQTLGAISSILFRAHHEEVSRKRTAGTCEWILKREKFIQWEESDSSFTILYGNPGAGKTFLISRVVDNSIERARTGDAVAFFYCKRDEENRRNPQDILRSILRQLSSPVKETEGGMIHVAVKDLPNRLELKGTTFDVSTCEGLIGKLIEDYSRTTIIVDALDECERSTRDELMRVLSNLKNSNSRLRVFISSRHDEDIRRHFKGSPIMEIQATDNEEDISSFVGDRLFLDSRWGDLSSELQEEVKAVFHEKSHGMFQWAALQVDQIHRLKIWSERSIREQLKISPIGLKAAYDVVWNQIQEMSPYEKQLAGRAFQWVLCAFRRLETSELSLMMQIDPNSGKLDSNTVFASKTIENICGNLLVYNGPPTVFHLDHGRWDTWRFSHLSAREYIEKHHYSMLESHQHVALSSTKFLGRISAWLPPNTKCRSLIPCRWVGEYYKSDPRPPRIEHSYIIEKAFWHVHELDSSELRHDELTGLLKKFFEPISHGSSSFQAWAQVCDTVTNMTGMSHHPTTRVRSQKHTPSAPLQALSIYGIFHILREVWEKAKGGLNVFPMSAPLPLALAIWYGHKPIWNFILLAKANVNSGTPRPLTVAIRRNDKEAFEALLEANADINDIETFHENDLGYLNPYVPDPDTPLQAALWHSQTSKAKYFLQRLLDNGADVNLKSGLESTLELAVQYSDEEAVQILLCANTEAYSPDHLLRLATQNRKFNLVPLFVRLGANIEEPWEEGLPIVCAMRNGNLRNVRSLLEMSDARMDFSSKLDREAILSALLQCDGWDIFSLLFASSAHIYGRDYKTPIEETQPPIRLTLRRVITSYPIFRCELQFLGFNGPHSWLPPRETAAHQRLSLVQSLINAGSDPYISVDLCSGRLTAAGFHDRLHHFQALLDQEEAGVKEEQKYIFRAALFAVLSGRLSILFRESAANWRKPFSNEMRCPAHLEVLRLIFERKLGIYFPTYNAVGALTPAVQINREVYEIIKPCRLYREGYYGYFSRFWFFAIWDLQKSKSPPLPLGSQLRQWQFPGTFPDRCFIATKVTAISTARPAYFIILSICGSRSQFNIVSAPKRVCMLLSQKSEDGRWKKYKPESFGAARFTDPDVGIDSGNTKAPASRGKLKANPSSWYWNMFTFVLLAFVVGLLSFFIALL